MFYDDIFAKNKGYFMTMIQNITKSKIMIVSKNNAYSYLIEEIIKKSDDERIFEFINALGIKNAIEKALWENPHLIIIDIDTDIKEVESLDFFYQNKLTKKIPVLLIVDIEHENKKLKKFLLHKYDFIKKPLNHKELQIRANYLINLYKEYLQKEINQTFIINSLIEKRAKEIEKRKKFFKILINACDNMIGIIDINRKVIEINRKWIKEFGSRAFTNKVLNEDKLFRKYIPIYEDKTFLNNYDRKEWIEKLRNKNLKVNNILISRKNSTYLYKIDFFEMNFLNKSFDFENKDEKKFIISLRSFSKTDDFFKN